MCWQTVLSCLHWALLLNSAVTVAAAAAVVVIPTMILMLGFLDPAARTDWELEEGPGLSRQNIHPLDAFPSRTFR